MKRFCYLILNYETYEETLACAESVWQIAGAGLAEGRDRIVIVDNGSSEANLAGLKKGLAALDYEKSVAEESIPSYVTLIEAGKNLGFAKGNNLGFVYAKEHWDPDFIVMMNNDIVLTQNDLEERVEFLYDRYGFAVCGGDWTDPAGEIHFNPQVTKEISAVEVEAHIRGKERELMLAKAGVEPIVKAAKKAVAGEKVPATLRKLRSRIEEKTFSGEKNIAVKCTPENHLQLHGCMLIFSRKYADRFDGLYDKTFLYYEEDFLRLRCERAGLRMYFFPELKAIHNESMTERAVFGSVREKHIHRNSCMVGSLKLLREYMKDPSADPAFSGPEDDAWMRPAAGENTDAEPSSYAASFGKKGFRDERKHCAAPGSAKGCTEKKVSIAMTTYNGEQYVVEQLDSLLAQTLPADEIIIADDRSTDATWEILQAYAAEHPEAPIKLHLNEENLGYKKNFHSVLEEVTGDYIFLCDQDDDWNPDKLELCVRLMDVHPEILALNTGFEFMDKTGEFIPTILLKGRANNNIVRATMKDGELRRFGTEALVLANLSPGCTMCIRKEMIGEFLPSYNYALPHDYFINLLASLKNGCYFLNTPTIRYRIHDKNTIGLVVVEEDDSRPFYDLHVLGVYETRLKEAQDLIEIFDAVWNTGIEQKWSGRYRDFLKARYVVLRDRSLLGFLKLLTHLHLYHKIFTVRRIAGDLYYVLHMDQILKRH